MPYFLVNFRLEGLFVLFRIAITTVVVFTNSRSMPDPAFYQLLFSQHADYQQPNITRRRFTLTDVAAIIDTLRGNNRFEITTAGRSFQGRDIYLVKAGTGPTKILLWSQMHGDEATATMALLDIFTFLSGSNDGLDEYRRTILERTTLYFVPMLNPDGAEVFERRNAQGIDMNRDAQRLQTPEGRLLQTLQQELRPDFGFNLHDQNIRYTAGKTPRPATISLLAPPIDEQNTVNDVRKKAIQVIVQLNRHLQTLIPDQIGRWPDDFEPRAFGENVQQWGTSTILVESGGYANDPEKQFIRKLNFVLLLDAFHQIATESYIAEPTDAYERIPINEKYLFDLLIRNATFHDYRVDVGINRTEKTVGSDFYYESQIDDWGDLSVFYGYQEWDAKGLQVEEGKMYPQRLPSVQALDKIDPWTLLAQGYTTIQVGDVAPKNRVELAFPTDVLSVADAFVPQLGEGKKANFLFTKEGKVCYAVVNGFLYDVREKKLVK